MKNNPYIGARAFKAKESLYGRNKEVVQLLDLLIAERIVLLYSPSGAGKTSLIQASLKDALEANRFRVFDIIRVNYDAPDNFKKEEKFNRYVFSVIQKLEEERPADSRLSLDKLASLTLTEYFELTGILNEKPSRVLIFDQFEEVLTVDPSDRLKKEDFFKQLGDALSNFKVWALFAMREDFVGAILPFAKYIPKRFSARLHLDLLAVSAARKSIINPAAEKNVQFLKDAADKLVDDLRTIRVQQPDGSTELQLGPSIEPVQLQVVCYELWDKIPEGTTEITRDQIKDFGDVNMALANYYAGCVRDISGGEIEVERRIRDWFSNALITEHGIRGQVLRTSETTQGLENAKIEALINKHIVRGEKRLNSTWYELAHDRLIDPVLSNNAQWFSDNLNEFQSQALLWEREGRPERLLLNEQAMIEIEGWVIENDDKLTLTEKKFWAACEKARLEAEEDRNELVEQARQERKQKDKYRRLSYITAFTAGIAVLLAIVAFGTTLYAWSVNKTLEKEKKQADSLRDDAQAAATDADIQRRKADEAAKEQEKLAESEKKQREQADKNLEEAKKQEDIAKTEKARAENQTKLAGEAKKKAVELLGAAETARQNAVKYENLGLAYSDVTGHITNSRFQETVDVYQNIARQYREVIKDKSNEAATFMAIGEVYKREAENIFAVETPEINNKIKYYNEALKSFDEAANLKSDTRSVIYLTEKANILTKIADAYQEMDDDESSIQKYLEAGNIYIESDPAEAVNSFIKAGNAAKKIGNDKKAKESFNAALDVYPDDEIPNKIKTLLRIAVAYAGDESNLVKDLKIRNDDDRKMALSYFKQAGELFKNLRGSDEALVGLLSIAEFQKNPLDKIEFYEKAAQVARRRKEKEEALIHDEEALILMNIGYAYLSTGADKNIKNNSEDAESIFGKAVDYYKKSNDYLGEAWTLNEIGRAFYSVNDYARSDDYFRRAQEVFRDRKDSLGEAFIIVEKCRATKDLLSAPGKSPLLEECILTETQNVPGIETPANKAALRFKIGELYMSNLYRSLNIVSPRIETSIDNRDDLIKIALQNFNEALTEYIKASDSRGQSLSMVKIGALYNRSDKQDEQKLAKENFDAAIRLQKGNDSSEAEIYVQIGSELIGSGNNEEREAETFDYFSRAINIYEKLNKKTQEDIDSEARAFTGLIHLGKIEDDDKYYEKALTFYKKYLTELSYLRDDYYDGTFCTAVLNFQNTEEKFFSRLPEIDSKSIEIIKNPEKRALKYNALAQLYEKTQQLVKVNIAYYFSSRLFKKVDDKINSVGRGYYRLPNSNQTYYRLPNIKNYITSNDSRRFLDD